MACEQSDSNDPIIIVDNEPIKPLVICGPSGVGKGTLIKKLQKEYSNHFSFSVSHTTRKPRPGEIHGIDYYFTNLEKMQKEIENGNFLEYANVHGNLYGTSKQAVLDVQQKGKCCILDIDTQGAVNVKKFFGTKVYSIFICPPSEMELERRLRGRNTETEEVIQLRLANAKKEIQFAKANLGIIFDDILINDDIEIAFQKMKKLLIKNLNINL